MKVQVLFEEIEKARMAFIIEVQGLTLEQVGFKAREGEWTILEIAEHIVWAEQIGVCGMFRAIEGIRNHQPIWEGDSPNANCSIEEIIQKTWQPKEKVPKVAEPRWGGSIAYWIDQLKNCRHMLEALIQFAEGVDLAKAIYPHPISGPMDIWQRLAFLRFHLDRHREQVRRVKGEVHFPKAK